MMIFNVIDNIMKIFNNLLNNKTFGFTTIIILIFMINNSNVSGSVKMPGIFSDNMVIQRDIPVKIWGWADAGEKVSISYNGQKLTAKADKNGVWSITLKPMKFGGPFDMVIKAKNEIILKNTLIGDVWICGGQSNIEFPVNQLENASDEISSANFPGIRLFTVPKQISEKPLENIDDAKWEVCSPATISSFSAVGYFFGKNLCNHLNVPVGLISSNWGGTNIETWTGLDAMEQFDEYKQSIEEMKKKDFSKIEKNLSKLQAIWNKKIETDDSGKIQKWFLPETNFSGWKDMKLPQFWEKAGLPDVDGVVWFKMEFELTSKETLNDIKISLGKIRDADQTYLNGELVGETYNYTAMRNYSVAAKFLKPGKNILVIRVINYGWEGGFWGDAKDMYVDVNGFKKSLAIDWKYKLGISLPSPFVVLEPNKYPSMLYNSMISPLTSFGIKGVIWYQGETNVNNAFKYRNLLSGMINDWRKHWDEGNFPFLIVQLPNYDAIGNGDGGDWPLLRESQAIAVAQVPNTGMAITIDVGESKNIHPKNKLDVGYRLYLVARKIAYNENLVYSGPTYKSMKIEGNKIEIEFDNIGSGLYVKDKYGYINGFCIAGDDKKFHWAKAYIDGNRAVVHNDTIQNPVAVRYAWLNDPSDINLYNKEMLPAAPFRTDLWNDAVMPK